MKTGLGEQRSLGCKEVDRCVCVGEDEPGGRGGRDTYIGD